jgi:hypothetical protein
MLAAPALGQAGSISADRLRLPIDREGILDVQSGSLPRHLEYDLALSFDYALSPLVVFEERRFEDRRQDEIVSGRAGARLFASLALFDWVSLGLEVPYITAQTGDEDVFGLGENPVAASGLGDLRFTPKARLLTRRQAGFDLAVLAPVELPTASPRGAWLGDDGVVVEPQLALSHDARRVRLALNIGARLAGEKEVVATRTGSAILARAAAQYRLDAEGLPLGLAFGVSTEAAAAPELFAADQTGAEVLFAADYTFLERIVVTAGGAVGALGAPRVPEFRAFGVVRYAPRDTDLDDDGVHDRDDACVETPEDRDGFRDGDGCPDLDNDGDGAPDEEDSCPDQAEDVDGFQDGDGCPDPDDDEDGVPDVVDGCRLEAEDIDEFEDEDGCPDLDNDGDQIPDAEDACPGVAGDPREGGCPFIDVDSDGVHDPRDQCVGQPEDRDGFEDEDGCPDPDNDADGVPDVDDKCPGDPEDRDDFESEDGCPDPDNDEDGILDIDDRCPNEAETRPGEDADGCPGGRRR